MVSKPRRYWARQHDDSTWFEVVYGPEGGDEIERRVLRFLPSATARAIVEALTEAYAAGTEQVGSV